MLSISKPGGGGYESSDKTKSVCYGADLRLRDHFLFTNCSPSESRVSAPVNDLTVIGPDGKVLNSLQPSVSSPSGHGSEKLYWNNSGDPTRAPRWPQKTISWYYNPDGQPPQFTDAQAIAIIQNGMKTWESVCGIKWVCQELTNRAYSVHNDATNTIGWSAANNYAGMTTIHLSSATVLAEGDIDLANTQVTDETTLQGVINHELGHQLGLAHPDVAESIMYANPYHPVPYLLTLRQDDIDGCVGLYGAPNGSTPTVAASPTPSPLPTATPSPSPTPVRVPPLPTPSPVATPSPSPFPVKGPLPSPTPVVTVPQTPTPAPIATPVPSRPPRGSSGPQGFHRRHVIHPQPTPQVTAR